MMPRTVAIVGASADRRKFGNKSVRAHAAAGWHVYPIHPSEQLIEGWAVFGSVRDLPVESLDRISVYLPAAICLSVLPEFATKPAGEVWLNPGADDAAVVAAARELGLTVVQGCSIVDVGYGPWQFGD